MRRSLTAAVKDILAACPAHLHPQRDVLIQALKMDRGKKRWPDADVAAAIGGNWRVVDEARWRWPKTLRVMADAIVDADW